MSYNGTKVKKDSLKIIIHKELNSFTVSPLSELYEWRKLQIRVDSLIKKEGYQKDIIVKKDEIIDELKNSNKELKKVAPLLIDEVEKKTSENKELKAKNKNLRLSIGLGTVILILETILLIK